MSCACPFLFVLCPTVGLQFLLNSDFSVGIFTGSEIQILSGAGSIPFSAAFLLALKPTEYLSNGLLFFGVKAAGTRPNHFPAVCVETENGCNTFSIPIYVFRCDA
jgi:hypothetical protein